MKFRFNGDADCPDWILAEIYNLSQLSSIKLKTLGQIVTQGINTPPIQMEKVEKLFADSKLDADIDLRACIACLTYIISSATRFNCDSNALQSELQQLGLPREHSNSIRRVFDEYNGILSNTFKAQSMKINSLENVSSITEPGLGYATLNLDIQGRKELVTLCPRSVDSLLAELTHVKRMMTDLKKAS